MCILAYFRTFKQCLSILTFTDRSDSCEANQALPADTSQTSSSSQYITVFSYMCISGWFNPVIVSDADIIDF